MSYKFTPEQEAQLKELYAPVKKIKTNEKGLRKAVDAYYIHMSNFIQLPRYNSDGTRRQGEGLYRIIRK